MLRTATFVVAGALLLSHLLGWYSAVAAEPGGFEGITRRTDYVSTLTGALVIHEGHAAQLYDLDVQYAAQNRVLAPYRVLVGKELLPYNHMPFEALLAAPLVGLLPYSGLFVFWTLLTALALALALRLMQGMLPLPRQWLAPALLLIVSYGPVVRSFILGQNSPLVLLGLCGTYAALRRGNQFWAGAALLLLALKPQLLPLVLLLLVLLSAWRALFTFASLLVVLCLATMPLLGTGWPSRYLNLLVGVAGWGNTGAIDPAIMHNWRGFATNLFAGWAPAIVTPAFVALSTATATLLVVAWFRSRPLLTPSISGSGRYDLLWALTGVGAVLTSIHLNPHDLTLLIFPAWICLAYLFSGIREPRRALPWLCVLMACYLLLSVLDPAAVVVPSVVLLAALGALLSRQLLVTPVSSVAG